MKTKVLLTIFLCLFLNNGFSVEGEGSKKENCEDEREYTPFLIGNKNSDNDAGFFLKMVRQAKYIIGKIPEAGHFLFNFSETKGMLADVFEANDNKKNEEPIYIPLSSLRLYHPIGTDGAKKKLAKRIKMLEDNKEKVKEKSEKAEDGNLKINMRAYQTYIPSIDPIAAFRLETLEDESMEDLYLIGQGQGRVAALLEVFPPETLLEVMVSSTSKKALQKMWNRRMKYVEEGKIVDKE